MIIHMVSEHASPLAVLGGADAGGQNVHVAALAAALGAAGHQVTVFTRRDGPAPPARVRLAPGVVVEQVPAGPPHELPKDELLPYMPDFAEYLARRWLTERPDVVHAHFWMSGYAALLAARDPGIPVAQTFHALGSVKRRHQRDADTSPPEREWLEPWVARQARSVIATCTSEVRELRAYGMRPDSAVVIPCGVDLDLFRPDGPVAERNGRPRILSIGRMVPRKGVDTAVEALAMVPDAELVVAGGPDRPRLAADPEVGRLRAAARRHGVADRVSFVGRVPHENAPALMRSADVVVSVPWYEPFGMVPVEAMACGATAVASAVGGHLDTIVPGETGLHVPPRDPAELAARLRELLADPRRRAELGRAGARRAHDRYSWRRIAAATEQVYRRLAGSARTRLVGTARTEGAS